MARLLAIVSAALAVLLGYFVVRIALGLLAPESLERPMVLEALPPVPAAQAASPRLDFSTDPFKAASVSVAPVIDPGLDAPETTLKLVLMGRTTGPDGGAILRLPDNSEKRVGIGEELLPNVTLTAVNADFILMDVDGQAQRLTFERNESLVGQRAPMVPNSAPVLGEMNLQELLRNVRMDPKRQNGKMLGLQISGIGDGEAKLALVGLRSGDILTRIGTVDLTTNRTNMAEVQALIARGQPVDIQYLRDGQIKYARIGQ